MWRVILIVMVVVVMIMIMVMVIDELTGCSIVFIVGVMRDPR